MGNHVRVKVSQGWRRFADSSCWNHRQFLLQWPRTTAHMGNREYSFKIPGYSPLPVKAKICFYPQYVQAEVFYEKPLDHLPIFWIWRTTPCDSALTIRRNNKNKLNGPTEDICSGSFLIHNCTHLSSVPGHIISWPHFSQRCLSPWPLTCLSLALITQPYTGSIPGPYHPAKFQIATEACSGSGKGPQEARRTGALFIVLIPIASIFIQIASLNHLICRELVLWNVAAPHLLHLHM